MLGVYDLYSQTTPNPTTLHYHRIAEIFKFTYGKRSNIGDPTFDPEIQQELDDLISPQFWQETKAKINDDQTSQNVSYYGGYFQEDHGTSHISVMTQDESIALTCTVNLYFGSKIKGKRTGVIFNDSMDDFSSPGVINDFGVKPSPANFIKPGKRPQSSMSPSIISELDTDLQVMTIGGAGGTKITTASAFVALNIMAFEKAVNFAVAEPRLHHQLDPMVLQYQDGFDLGIIGELRTKRDMSLKHTVMGRVRHR